MKKKERTTERIVLWLLCMAMVFGIMKLSGFTMTAYAANTLDIQNVNIAADGTMTWDAFKGATDYYLIISTFDEIVEGTSCNLSQILEKRGKPSGNYEIELCARDDSYLQISTKYITNYSYTARNPQLATPTNFVWNGSTVSWDLVENATSYYVFVYKDSFSAFFIGVSTVYENKIDITEYFSEGTNDYGVMVFAKADGYPDSERGESDFKTFTKTLPNITGVKIAANGTMTWNAFSGAANYEICLSTFSETITGTSANLKESLRKYGKPSGEYEVTLKALDSSYKQISKAWTGTYHYTAPTPLSAPTNLVWNDRTVTWDPVTNATSYYVALYRDTYYAVSLTSATVTETLFEVPVQYLIEGTKNYGVRVSALSDEYPSSEFAASEFHQITYLKPSVQNVRINDGILSWDSFTGANDYVIEISADDIGVTYTEETTFNVDAILKANTKPNGEYSITLSARDSAGNRISTITSLKYQYVIMYDIKVESVNEAKGTVKGSGRYPEGSYVTIQAYPKEGYLFDYWTNQWGGVIEGAGKEYSFVVEPSGCLQYVAWFKKNPVLEPVITKQPAAVNAAAGETVKFSIVATGATSYQWQFSADNGSTWSNCAGTGYNTANLSFTMAAKYAGRLYRCVVKNAQGNVNSAAVALTLKTAGKPAITTQPVAVKAAAGENVKFSVTATGATSYQWQFSADNGSTWSNCNGTGYNTANLSFTMAAKYAGRVYRCVVKNAQGSVNSTAVALTLKEAGKPVITTQPVAVKAAAGETVKFSIAATGVTSYQWQFSADNGSTWSNCSGTGYNTANLSFTMAAKYAGRLYRCVVKNASGSVNSTAVALTLKTAGKPVITTQPVAVNAAAGENVKFSIAATGATSYQWQFSADNGSTWSNCSGTGYNTASLSFTMAAKYAGRLYRCIVKNAQGSVNSNAVALTLKTASKPVITTQPVAVKAAAGETVKFSVTATGATSYQWQFSADNGSTWSNCAGTGYNTANLSFSMAAKYNGRLYRCVVKNAQGSVNSTAVALTLK